MTVKIIIYFLIIFQISILNAELDNSTDSGKTESGFLLEEEIEANQKIEQLKITILKLEKKIANLQNAFVASILVLVIVILFILTKFYRKSKEIKILRANINAME